MIDRVLSAMRLLLFILADYLIIYVGIEPGDSMGSRTGDKPNLHGNSHSRWPAKIAHRTLFLLVTLLAVWGGSPSSGDKWIVLVVGYLGCALRYWAYLALDCGKEGTLFTFKIGIRKGHRLIRDGPYRFFAHPGYVGQTISMLAFMYVHHSTIFFTLPLVAYYFYVLRYRIIAEEQMLSKHFGKAYAQFVNQPTRFSYGRFAVVKYFIDCPVCN